jgi:hypothetical protein
MTFLWLPGNLRGPLLNQGGFSPAQVSAVTSWLRLAASTQSGGEWTSIVDVLNAGSPVTQTDADRRTAVGSSGNGLPTMTFDGTDVHVWALNANTNNRTDKLGFWLWFYPNTVSGVQRLLNITVATGCAVGLEKLSFYANNATLLCEVYATNTTGRVGTTATNVLTAQTWHAVYLQYDSSRGGDANLAIFTAGVSRSLNYTNIGVGATLGALQAPTGNCLIGGFNNVDAVVQGIADEGELGPNLFAFNDNLTAAQITSFLAFEAPTL